MMASAGNLDDLLGFAFNPQQFVNVNIASFAQSPDGTVLELLAEALGTTAAPSVADVPSYCVVAAIADGADQVQINTYADGTNGFLQASTYNVLGYNAGAILVSSMPLSGLIAALLARQSVAGQVGAITAGTPTSGAFLKFVPGGVYVGSLACFVAGTRILTAHGEVAVERLRVGSLVPGQVSGRMRRIAWIGRRTVQVARHLRPWDVAPVRIRADAFAPGRPHRDIRLSPDHAVLVDGALIPVRYLVNGATIVQEFVEAVVYWHVELDMHDVLLADGAPCESYLDTGNRHEFANAPAAARLPPASPVPRPWRPPARVLAENRPQPHGDPR